MEQPQHIDFPVIAYGEAGVAEDGHAVLVQLFTVGGEALHFSVKRIDLKKLSLCSFAWLRTLAPKLPLRSACNTSPFRCPA